ncbi:MAG: CRTAC1 family protein [Verrucomicrobia bacterium]|nr:CRTAC1 family protein [Verrucomicrobiota bacterium]
MKQLWNPWVGWLGTTGLGLVLAGALVACKPEPAVDGRPVGKPGAGAGDHGALVVAGPIPAGPNDAFEEVAARAGLAFVHQFCDTRIANIIESNGAGAAVLDFDRDGWMDVYLVNSGPLDGVTHHEPGTAREPSRLYRNRGDGTFEEVTLKAGVAGRGYGTAAVAADYDADGYPDLYVVNVGKNILYRNRGDGTFEEVTDRAGVGDAGTGIGAVFFDADGDAKLDLFVANYLTYDPNYKLYYNPDGYPGPLSYRSEFNVLYRNRGDGTFEDISARAGVRLENSRAMSVCAFDFDQDGDADLYICNDATPNQLLVNDGRGQFKDIALQAGVAFNALGEAAGSMTAAIGDCNGDLLLDILVSRLGYGSLYLAKTNRLFEDRMMASGLGQLTAEFVGWGSNFLDFDNDGDLDILVANGDAHHLVGWESLLLENTGAGNYTNAREKGGAFFDARLRNRGSALLDFDNDGRLDLLITGVGDRAFLLHNRLANGHHWLMLDLEGVRGNREGFGARITLTAGSQRYYTEARCFAGFLGSSDRRLHFGLGQARVVDQIEIRWPSGTVQRLEQVPVNQILKVKEP